MGGERAALAEGGFIKTLCGKVKGLQENEEKHFGIQLPLGALGALAVLIPRKC